MKILSPFSRIISEEEFLLKIDGLNSAITLPVGFIDLNSLSM